MTFELASLIVVALVAVALGLVCYYLLGRVEMLERAVQGGLEAPTTRLSREQFEHRFRVAHARSELARSVDTGILLVVGAEFNSPENDLAATVEHLARRDAITVQTVEQIDAETLGVSTTPYLFVVDDGRVRSSRAVISSADLVEALKALT